WTRISPDYRSLESSFVRSLHSFALSAFRYGQSPSWKLLTKERATAPRTRYPSDPFGPRPVVPSPPPWTFFGVHTARWGRRSSRLTERVVSVPSGRGCRPSPSRLRGGRAHQSPHFVRPFQGDRKPDWTHQKPLEVCRCYV